MHVALTQVIDYDSYPTSSPLRVHKVFGKSDPGPKGQVLLVVGGRRGSSALASTELFDYPGFQFSGI